jgi:AcrR family transcriptional regulator
MMAGPAYGPRERMVYTAAQLIRREGVGATGMREVAARAKAPRGSLQHYFPGGKQQLVNEAVAWAGDWAGGRVAGFVAALPEPSPSGLFAAMVRQWTDEYLESGFAGGCPAAAAAFAAWTGPVARALVAMGVPQDRAGSLAALMVSALEGAILLARSEQDTRALTVVARELAPLLDGAVVEVAPAPPG